MNKQTYRKARKLVRANGLYALRWLPVEHAACMLRVSRPAADVLVQRAETARVERAYGATNPGALAFRLTTHAKKRQT